MTAHDNTLQNSRFKAMVVPREHGAWGLLLVPLATGTLVVARGPINTWALGLFLIAAVALFWLRTPVEAWMGTSAVKSQSPQERAAVLRIALIVAALAAVAGATLLLDGYARGLLVIGTIAALLFALQAGVKRLGRRARMPAQVVGAAGLTSTAAGAYYVATGRLDQVAVSLWIANWLFAVNQVHFVQMRIHSIRATAWREKLRDGYVFVAGQIVLLVVVAALSRFGYFPKFAVIAFVPALVRGLCWFLGGRQALDVHKLGFSELLQAFLFGALLCVVFLI